MSIYDTMQFIKPDVSTMCMGMAASMGAILLTAGAKGKRFPAPLARDDLPASGWNRVQASDIEIHAREILLIKERLNQIIAERTGQPLEKVV